MKICIISGLYKEYIVGGGEIYVQRIVNKLSRNNDVIVITTSPDADMVSTIKTGDNIKIYTFRPLFSIYNANNVNSLVDMFRAVIATIVDIWNPHSYVMIRNILKKEMPDIVHINGVGNISTSAFSAVKSMNIPCIHTCHSYSLISVWPSLFNFRKKEIVKHFNIFDKIYMSIKRYLTRSIDMVTVPSNFVMDMHTRHGFFNDARQVVLPLGIDLHNVEMTKKYYDIFDILYVGRLVSTKGVQILIETVRKLENKNIRLHIVGKGPGLEYLKECAGSDTRIIFYGYVSDDDRRKLYQKANVVVVPSIWYDNSPVVIYESFGYGTPVIGSRIGGIPELVIDGYNGYLFDAGNIEELKAIFENLMEKSYGLKQLEFNAYHSARKYDIDEHILKLKELYIECIKIR